MKKNTLNFIDLFCGAGGFSLGFEKEGFNCIGAIDNDKYAIETHDLNFKNSKSICADIESISPENFAKIIGNKKVDIIIGGPPCPTFSTIGHAKIQSLGNNVYDDKRNRLFKNFLDYVEYFQPEFFIIENVPNFITKYEFFNIKILEGSINVFKLCSSTIPTNIAYNNMFQPNLDSMQLIGGQNIYINNTISRFDIQNIKYYRDTKKFEKNYFNKLYELNYNLSNSKKLSLNFIKNLIHNKIRLFDDDLNNIIYDETTNSIFKNEYNMQYKIVYQDNLFIKTFSSVILSTPIINTNNKLEYRIINPSRTSKYEYKELFESDLTNNDYNTKFYDIYYDPNDDTFYMENIANSHKFTILGHVDSVVVGLEFITCQLKQLIS